MSDLKRERDELLMVVARVLALADEFDEAPLSDWRADDVAKEIRAAVHPREAPDA